VLACGTSTAGELTGPDADPVAGGRCRAAEAPDLDERLTAVAERAEAVTLRAQLDRRVGRVEKAQWASWSGCAASWRRAGPGRVSRTRNATRSSTGCAAATREQGSRLREAMDGTRAAERELAELRERSAAELTAALADRDRARDRAAAERARAGQASDEVTGARRRRGRPGRADEVRLELLVDTLSGAISGSARARPRRGRRPGRPTWSVASGCRARRGPGLRRQRAGPAPHPCPRCT